MTGEGSEMKWAGVEPESKRSSDPSVLSTPEKGKEIKNCRI